MKDKRNLSLVMDFYELTMSQCYFNDNKDKEVVFDLFYRKNPDDGGYCVFAGLEQVVDYVSNLHFEKEDIDYLRSLNQFSEDFLEYLSTIRFTGDIYAIPEGTPVFPNEPLITVKAKAIEAQLIETMLLLTINHQSLIATKANRIRRAAEGKEVLELGARRSQGYDAAIYGARAAYIGGVDGTANTIADEIFGVKAVGTMAHSWIQLFGDEYKAFETYAKTYPDNCVLLIDTYNVLKSGIINAIKVSKDVLEPQGKSLKGVRLDSGDLAYLSKEVRKILNINGLENCKILASNSLDEYIIADLMNQGACIDIFGVGERLITAKSEPVFGGVYKLVAVEENDNIVPRIKLSENIEKVTSPGYKTVWRLFDKENNKAIADVLTLGNEIIDDSKDYEIFDPIYTWKRKVVTNYYAKKIQVPIFIQGKCVYKTPKLDDIRKYSLEQVESLWDEVKRFNNPQAYYVDLSEKLWNLKNDMIKNFR